MDISDDEGWLKPAEAARWVGVDTTQLMRAVYRGMVPERFYGRFGRFYRFKRHDLDNMLAWFRAQGTHHGDHMRKSH